MLVVGLVIAVLLNSPIQTKKDSAPIVESITTSWGDMASLGLTYKPEQYSKIFLTKSGRNLSLNLAALDYFLGDSVTVETPKAIRENHSLNFEEKNAWISLQQRILSSRHAS